MDRIQSYKIGSITLIIVLTAIITFLLTSSSYCRSKTITVEKTVVKKTDCLNDYAKKKQDLEDMKRIIYPNVLTFDNNSVAWEFSGRPGETISLRV